MRRRQPPGVLGPGERCWIAALTGKDKECRSVVIPGRPKGPRRESRSTLSASVWIPGSLAPLAPRNDLTGLAEPGLQRRNPCLQGLVFLTRQAGHFLDGLELL